MTPSADPLADPARAKPLATAVAAVPAGRGALPISAVLITRDAERHLDQALAALHVCDEILILDSGSTDRTLAIAQRHGARVEHHEFHGFGPMKRLAVSRARHDWVLSIDADEVLDPEAIAALATLDFGEPRRAYRIHRRNFVAATEVRHGAWNPDFCVRLFNRTGADFTDAEVHESVHATGPIAPWPGSLLHYSFPDFAEVFQRCGKYARLKTQRLRERGVTAGAIKLLVRMGWGFFRSYVLKRGFLDGRAGVLVALSVALDAVLALAQASEPSPTPAPPTDQPGKSGGGGQ
jgi:glycosyltransferase involved in cell wall biosynthesis